MEYKAHVKYALRDMVSLHSLPLFSPYFATFLFESHYVNLQQVGERISLMDSNGLINFIILYMELYIASSPTFYWGS